MTKLEPISKIDAVDIGEVTINLAMQGNFTMMIATAHYALVVTETGVRVGKGTVSSWSPATQQKVKDLLAAMEGDICVEVFGKGPQPVEGAVQDTPNSDGIPGL